MIIYIVFGVEYHVGRTILGIFDSKGLAEKCKLECDKYYFNDIIIQECTLNEIINND